jgi:hypothetical protein
MIVAELFATLGLVPQGWEKGQSLIQGLASAAKRLIAVEAVRSIVSFTESVAENATHLVSLAQSFGATIGQAQELGYVASQSGSNLRELSVGMSMFIRQAREVAQGRGGRVVQATFREIGLSADDAKAALASPEGLDTAINKIADRLHAMGNTAERAAVGTRLFGARAGRAMVADLSRGSAALGEMRQHFKDLGAELTDKEAFSLRDLNSKIKDLHVAWDGVMAHLVADLAPVLIPMLQEVAHWIATLGALFRSALGGNDGAVAIVIGLVAALGALAAPIIAALLPVIAIGAAVAAVAYAVIELVRHWGDVKRAAGDAWEWIKTKASEAWHAVIDPIVRGVEQIEAFGRRVMDALEAIGDFVTDTIPQAFRDAFNAIAELPVIKQLLYLVQKVGELARSGAKPGELETPGALKGSSGGAINDFLNSHPFLASFAGGGSENLRRGLQGEANAVNVAAGATVTTTNNVTNQVEVKVDGTRDPHATGAAVADHIENISRHTLDGVGGQVQ